MAETVQNPNDFKLENGSCVAVIGGGPTGSLFSFFLKELSRRVGIQVDIDVFERQDFNQLGPKGCNHCGGIVSESLVQLLSSEGVNLPDTVVRRGIDAYVMHMDVGSIRIETPLHEKRIAAMYRGAGPLGSKNSSWKSFDGFLQQLTVQNGVNVIRDQVNAISLDNGRPQVRTKNNLVKAYDLVVGAMGINSPGTALFNDLGFGYQEPGTTKTYICEFFLGRDSVQKTFGNSMHVFLLNIDRLEFGAIIPKGDFVTTCLLGRDIDKNLVQSFMEAPEVKACFPAETLSTLKPSCACFPKINTRSAVKPFGDRFLLIGDCATTKLFKNGIGAAYTGAKAAATTAVFHGVSSRDFERHYAKYCRAMDYDNLVGKGIFTFTHLIQRFRFTRKGIYRMVAKEQTKLGQKRHMSAVLWDTFTGSASYGNIFLRTLKPAFIIRLIWETIMGFFSLKNKYTPTQASTDANALGKIYQDGQEIVRQGEPGEFMFVIQSGEAEVFQVQNNKEVRIARLESGDFFGEMAVFERTTRSATVRATGTARVLTVDKKTLLGRIQQDPSLAFRMIEKLSHRLRELDAQVSRIRANDRRNWETRPEDRE